MTSLRSTDYTGHGCDLFIHCLIYMNNKSKSFSKILSSQNESFLAVVCTSLQRSKLCPSDV